MTTILIADDHPLVLSGIESVLRDSGFQIVAVVGNGNAVLECLGTTRPDILLLDVNMPGRTGLEILRTLRSRGDQRAVVLLTASLRDSELVEALQLGVNGFMLKDGAASVLVTCLNQVRNGQRWIDRTLLERGLDLTLNGNIADQDALAPLTPRERAIARLVARGMRNKEVAEELGLTEGTVKVWLHRIYEKLGISNRTELAILSQDR
jgi:two-component system, NarL family, nitrate/nitrite response regulator NarL